MNGPESIGWSPHVAGDMGGGDRWQGRSCGRKKLTIRPMALTLTQGGLALPLNPGS